MSAGHARYGFRLLGAMGEEGGMVGAGVWRDGTGRWRGALLRVGRHGRGGGGDGMR